MARTLQNRINYKTLAWLFVVGGALGLYAAAEITIDKFRILAEPGFVPSCSINPVLSCGSIMQSAQASAFGFPNPILGLIGFSAVIVVGMSIFAGAKFKTWYWRLFNLGPLFGVIFVHWLFFQSVWRIGALCLWCMLVWAVTIPIFMFTTLYNLGEGHITVPKSMMGLVQVLMTYKYVILVLWYSIIVGLIVNHFWYYFKTVL